MIEGEDRYARLAARVLRGLHESHGRQGSQGSTAVHLEGPPLRDDVRRDAIVAAMALAIAAKARRRRMVTLAVVTLAAAASVVVVLRLTGNGGLLGTKPGAGSALVVEQATGHGIQLVRATTTQPLPVLGVLAVGDGVRSGEDSSAVLGFANGTRITLSSSANLRIDDLGATRHFSLFRGSVQAQVAKLGQGERFVVSTPDSEVEVRGTVFTVTVESSPSRCRGSAGNSIVHVSEGAVWVRSGDKQVVLQPGETWVTPCPDSGNAEETAVETAERAPAVVPSPAEASDRSGAHTGAHKPAVARVPSMVAPTAIPRESPLVPAAASAPSERPTEAASVSRLSEQNDLFSAAMAAEHQGQHDLALRKLDDLIAHYPGGPLSESARAERQRILAAQLSR
jgi:ferric-dicitrate binding protein FerR (iron transport regulator)